MPETTAPGQAGPTIGQLIESDPVEALRRLEAIVARDPHDAAAFRAMARALRNLGRIEDAEKVDMAAVRAATRDPHLLAIAKALGAGDLQRAEGLLRERLRVQPTDVTAIRMMAELAARIGRYRDSEALLRRAVELAPGFLAARANLATVLYKQNRFAESAEVLDDVLARDPTDTSNLNLRAAALGRIGDYDEALRIFSELVEVFPDHAKLQMSLGHLLKTVGRQEEGVAAYRRAIAAQPDLGEAWWSLANLKTVKFDDADVAAMVAGLEGDPAHEDALHLHFALGKAYDDRTDHAKSFHHYSEGNRLRREEMGYDPDEASAQVDRVIELLTPEFLAAHEGLGDPAPDPIFIVGLPRAGSTLIEQILSSHSQIEGTMELPDIPAMAIREARDITGNHRAWPDAVAAMAPDRFAELGAEFLERTRVQRKTGRPFYIDKLPNNWAYVGFIHLILPNAKIIDARRDPMDCCFSNFRQHYAKGQGFSYGLDTIGRYYSDYVRAMDHYDRVLPGRIHRVIHEELLDEPEQVVRAMLDHLGLPFEESCLEFYKNDRAVRTASSEQVRRPLNRDGVGVWRPYDEWLGPLRDALGDLPETYARKA